LTYAQVRVAVERMRSGSLVSMFRASQQVGKMSVHRL